MGPSRSAMLVAACRMLEGELPSDERLIDDPMARLFVDERAVAAARADPFLQAVIRLRTRYIDDAVNGFVAAHPGAQVLLLGAGLDSRAYRLTADASFFEVDLPETLAYKASMAERAGLAAPARRVAVPVDLGTQPMAGPLEAAGFDRSIPTVVVWEGVINYLRNDEAEAVVREVAELVTTGSWLVADYVETSWYRGTFETATKTMATNLRDGGEPLRSGLDDVRATLQANRFRIVDDERVEVLPSRYGRPAQPPHYPARIFTAVRD